MQNELKRQVGPWGAVSLGLGSMLGTGVFVSLALAAEVAGSWILLAVPLAAAVAWCNARSSARLAARFPVSGGTYEYGHRLLSPLLGFSAGWLFLCAKSASAAAACLGIGLYLLHAIGSSDPWALSLVAILVLGVLTASVLAGLRRSTAINTVLLILTLSALALVVLVGLVTAFSNPELRVPSELIVTWSDIVHASALIFVAFTGYGRLATLGEEVIDPERTIPRAINSTVLVTALIYWLVALAGLAALGAGGFTLRASGAPLEAVVRPLGGQALAGFVAFGAATAMLGVGLNLLLGMSRVVLAMGRREELPVRLAEVDRAGNPTAAVLVVVCAVAVLVLVGGIRAAWSFSAVTVLLYYAITNVAALRLNGPRRRGDPVVAAIGLVGCVSLAAFIDVTSWTAAILLLGAGWALRAVVLKRKTKLR
jgi:basic amino acid/polyamine antiporter, APA family